MAEFVIKAVTTISGERTVEAPSQAEAVEKVKQELIKAGFSSPFGNPDVKHEIYVGVNRFPKRTIWSF